MSRDENDGPSHLAMRPAGFAGRLFGVVMERLNAAAYRQACEVGAPAPGESVVEIGFGTGRLVEMLLERVAPGLVAGVDPTPTMVEVALARRGVRRAGARADLRVGEASRLPWPDASFDAAFALHCFQFWANPAACAREIRRVLRPDGRLVVILREHGKGRVPSWLPNPISRSGDEAAGARACLAAAGFAVDSETTPHAIVARNLASA